jgi:hypothetical protein
VQFRFEDPGLPFPSHPLHSSSRQSGSSARIGSCTLGFRPSACQSPRNTATLPRTCPNRSRGVNPRPRGGPHGTVSNVAMVVQFIRSVRQRAGPGTGVEVRHRGPPLPYPWRGRQQGTSTRRSGMHLSQISHHRHGPIVRAQPSRWWCTPFSGSIYLCRRTQLSYNFDAGLPPSSKSLSSPFGITFSCAPRPGHSLFHFHALSFSSPLDLPLRTFTI